MMQDQTAPEEIRDADGERLDMAEQIAEVLQVPVSWVYARAAAGKIPSVKVGKYRRFNRAQVLASFQKK